MKSNMRSSHIYFDQLCELRRSRKRSQENEQKHMRRKACLGHCLYGNEGDR